MTMLLNEFEQEQAMLRRERDRLHKKSRQGHGPDRERQESQEHQKGPRYHMESDRGLRRHPARLAPLQGEGRAKGG